MGQRISIDKHVSSLDEILEISSSYYSRVKFETQIPESITQHIKVWKFTESTSETVRCSPCPLFNLPKHKFTLSSSECYMVMLIYRNGHQPVASGDVLARSLWNLVESTTNMTPRGLNEVLASNDESVCPASASTTLDSFLVSEVRSKADSSDNDGFNYMLYVWNGKTASAVVKAYSLAKGYEFDAYLQAGKQPLLQVLFSGGVIRNNKLQKGSVHALEEPSNRDENRINPTIEQLTDAKQRSQFLKWIVDQNLADEQSSSNGQGSPTSTCGALFNRLKGLFFSSATTSGTGAQGGRPSNGNSSKSSTGIGAKPGMSLNLAGFKKEPVTEVGMEDDDEDDDVDDDDSFGVGATGVDDDETELLNKRAGGAAPFGGIGLNLAGIKKGGNTHEESKGIASKSGVPSFNIGGNNGQGLAALRQNAAKDEHDGGHTNRGGVGNAGPGLGLNLGGVAGGAGVNKFGLRKLEVASFKTREEDRLAFKYDPSMNAEVIGDVRDTNRKEAKLRYYSKICSEIVPGVLFVGSDEVARNRDTLEGQGITNVINCAGDICANYFPDRFTYLTYHLKDSKTENIECLFYEVIDYIESVKKQGGRVFVHCIQGVSRSVTMCLAYIMFKEGVPFEEGLNNIKQLRGVSNPNMGFTVQLLHWYKRLYDDFDQIKVTPRVFAIGSHQVEQADKVVARMLIEAVYSPKNNLVLDKRGVFIVQSPTKVFLWIGDNINDKNRDTYLKKAHQHIQKLQSHERAVKSVVNVECGREPNEFWRCWNLDRAPSHGSDFIQKWDNWYIQLGSSRILTPHSVDSRGSNENREEKPEVKVRKMLYTYPDFDDPLRVFDIDELGDNDYLLLCVDTPDSSTDSRVYSWTGTDFEPNGQLRPAHFKESVLQHFLGVKNGAQANDRIKFYEEEAENESDEFLDYF